MKTTDPENVIGKIKLFVEDLELYASEDEQTAERTGIGDITKGSYQGQAKAYRFCAKWLKAYMEGNE